MKKSLLALFSASAMLVASSAMALPTGTPRQVFISSGLNDVCVGTATFYLDSSLSQACRYSVEWESAGYLPISVRCLVDEVKSHLYRSCLTNSQTSFDTIVQKSSYFPCQGFDKFQIPQNVNMWVMGESMNGALNGVIQLTGAASEIHSISVL